MLRPIVNVLRKNGIAFHNPYRQSNGFWNPLRTSSRKSAANRILALLVAHPQFGDSHRNWRNADLFLWAEWLRTGDVLTTDFRQVLAVLHAQEDVIPETLRNVLEPLAFTTLMQSINCDPGVLLRWWKDGLATEFRKRVQFPAYIAALQGPQAIRKSPQVVVGTIHSVKGGQADVVYLFPDLSKAADVQYHQCGPPRDSVIRTFYVGATRARETLYICSAEGAAAVSV
jgi:superfamily I DNA/RNA helicase